MADETRSGGVDADAEGDLNVGGDVVGRDLIQNTTTRVEGGPVARYAILGMVLIAFVAIAALTLILITQAGRTNPPSAAPTALAANTPAPAAAQLPEPTNKPLATISHGAAATSASAPAALPALPATYTPVPTQPPLPGAVNLSGNEGDSADPRLTVDGQGMLHLTWRDNSLRREGDIFYRHLTPNGTWSEAESLTADTAGFFDPNAQLLQNSAGQACLIWRVVSGSNGIVMRCREHDAWLPRVTLGNAGGSYSFAFDSDGKIKSVYNDRGSFNVYFEGRQLSAGPDSSSYPTLAIDAARGYHAVWLSASHPYRLRYRYSKDHGQTWTEMEHLTTDANSPDRFDLVADSAGNVHLVWHGFDGGLFYRRWSPAAGWSDILTLLAADSGLGQDPHLGVSARGLAQVVFTSRIQGVYYMAQGADGTWSTPRIISETGSSPRIAMDQGGNAHIVWADNRDILYTLLPQ